MNFSLFVLYTLTFFIIKADDDIPPVEVIKAAGGADVFCLFAYSRGAKPSYLNKLFPSAERVGVARLPYHRLDFNYYSENEKGSLSTIVPDCGYEAWGAIYYIPIQDLDQVLSKGGLVNNTRVFNFVPNTLEAYFYGSTSAAVNLNCNSFQQIELPEKLIYGLPLPENRRPPKEILDAIVEAFIDAGLPQKYIEEVSKLPVRSPRDA